MTMVNDPAGRDAKPPRLEVNLTCGAPHTPAWDRLLALIRRRMAELSQHRQAG